MKDLMSFEAKPERITVYFCKKCERQTVSGSYQPGSCCHCNHTEFWSEFDMGAPCNRDGEEEETEYFYDGEQAFEMKKVA